MNLPDFIDNRHGNTLALALQSVLDTGRVTGNSASFGTVRIATAFFNPSGFAEIADNLRPTPDVRLMLGVNPAGNPLKERGLGQTEVAFRQQEVQAGLNRSDEALRQERDHLPFTRTSRVALCKLIAALNAGNMEVRRYEKDFLHAKAYIFTPTSKAPETLEGIIAGSSNLTAAGLTKNLELNLGHYSEPIVEKALCWFDDLWEDAEPYDLADVFEEALVPRTPWEIFLRVLWQLYADEVELDAQVDPNLPLPSFQKHGVARALRLIRDTGGAIVADEVGLGKTFIAGEVLELYRARRQRALLICPAALRDSTWKKFLFRFEVFAECMSFEDLANDIQLRDARRPHANQTKLQRPLDEYQLVVVDEAHNYRNPDTPTRAAVLRSLLFGRKRDLLMLTATPVNNSLWDLYHLMRFFVRQDAHFADRGILSIRSRFERAMREDPLNLSPDALYPIIDATTVKRTRQFVNKHYAGDKIRGRGGSPQPIVFPKPQAISVRYNLDDLLPEVFDRLEMALDPDSADAISFARYMPDDYLLAPEDPEERARARGVAGLLRSGILKRFESSVFAFRKTIQKMDREHGMFLEALDAGYVVSTTFIKELSGDDEAVFDDVLAGTAHRIDATRYDVARLREKVTRDQHILRELAEEAATITPDRDPKLSALVGELIKIAAQADREATDRIDEAQKRKVLVFSFFEDTIEWIRDYLRIELGACASNRLLDIRSPL